MIASKGSLVFLSLLLLAASCSSSRKTTGSEKTANNPVTSFTCSNAGKSTTALSWVRITNPTAAEAGGRTFPAEFETYTIDNNQLKAFFTAAKQPDQRTVVSVPIPVPVGCQEFEVRNSAAMPQELAEKYPDMASLQGIGIENRAGDLRMDYDGFRLRGQVIWNGQIFLVTPVEYDKKLVYIIYDKSGSTDKKGAFESAPVTPRNENSGNMSPEMQKYDR